MSDFSLDLRDAEEELDVEEIQDAPVDGRIVLGTLDGTTPDEEWIAEVDAGNVLILAIEGDINELASGFARDIKENGGTLTHFRRFLVIGPPGVTIDTDRL